MRTETDPKATAKASLNHDSRAVSRNFRRVLHNLGGGEP